MTTITEADRQAWREANRAVEAIEAERQKLLAPTQARYAAAKVALSEIEDRLGGVVVCCEGCGGPVFEGEPYLGGETPLCRDCAPTCADLLDSQENFVDFDEDGDEIPMTAERARAICDAHLAAGGQLTDSMAR